MKSKCGIDDGNTIISNDNNLHTMTKMYEIEETTLTCSSELGAILSDT